MSLFLSVGRSGGMFLRGVGALWIAYVLDVDQLAMISHALYDREL